MAPVDDAQTTSRVRRSSMLRRTLAAFAVAGPVLVLVGFPRFPHIHGSFAVPVATVAAIAVLAATAALLGWYGAGRMPPAQRRLVAWCGSTLAGLWIVYILVTHLLVRLPQKPTVGAGLTAGTMIFSVVGVLAVAGFAAVRLGRWRSGLMVGLYCGLLAGLAAFLVTLAMLDLFMPYLVTQMNQSELAGYAGSGWPDRQAWYYWHEELPGAAGNLAYLLAFGAVAGIVGASATLLWPPARRRRAASSPSPRPARQR